MKNTLKHLLTLTFICGLVVACNDDSLNFSLTPSIGFAQSALSVIEDDADPIAVTLYSNVTLTEEVTITIAVNDVGAEYGKDYTTNPAPVNGTITLTFGPEDEPSFIIIPNGIIKEKARRASFELTSVTGANLALAEGSTTSFLFSIVPPEVDPDMISIAELRGIYHNKDTTLSEAGSKFIKAIVISSNDNVTAKNVYVQDKTAGIALRFNADNTTAVKKLVPGEIVKIPVYGLKLSVFNGLMQLGNGTAIGTASPVLLTHDIVIKDGTEDLPEPITCTVQQLNDKSFESMLVKVTGVSFAAANGTKTVSGNNTFSDGTVTSTMRVESYAPFSTTILPSGTVSITGVASYFNGGQIVPMKASDIQ